MKKNQKNKSAKPGKELKGLTKRNKFTVVKETWNIFKSTITDQEAYDNLDFDKGMKIEFIRTETCTLAEVKKMMKAMYDEDWKKLDSVMKYVKPPKFKYYAKITNPVTGV